MCVCYSDHALPTVPDAVEAKVKSKVAVVKHSTDDDDAFGSTKYAHRACRGEQNWVMSTVLLFSGRVSYSCCLIL